MQPRQIDQTIEQATRHQAAGRLREAEQSYRQILAAEPRHPEANHNLGVLLLESNRVADALRHLKTALDADPSDGQLWVSFIDALIHAGRYPDARAMLAAGRRRGLAGRAVDSLQRRVDILEPDRRPGTPAVAPAEAGRGPAAPGNGERARVRSLLGAGRHAEAETLVRALALRFPGDPWNWKMLGDLLRLQGRFDDALQAARRAVQLAPEDPEVHFELGLILDRLGQTTEGEASIRRALQLNPQLAEAHNELGMILDRTRRAEDAETSYRRALALRPDWPEVLSNLALALSFQGRPAEAEASLRRAIEVDPQAAAAHINLAAILRDTNRLDEAEQVLRRFTESHPQSVEARGSLLYLLNYMAAHSPEYCLAEAKRYGRIVRERVTKPFSSWTHAADPDRLRIGILSGDLHSHPVGFFLENVLAHLDRGRLEVIAYPTNSRFDALTQRLQPYFAAWRPLGGHADEAAAQRIHRDGIHVLLELSGHTSHNRLPLLAWKPAPIQVSWLGYFATTGVAEIDYLLADPVSVPPEHRSHFIEDIWHLPDTRLCFTPSQDAPETSPLPALAQGFVTFGSFQTLNKLNDEVMRLWAQVLAALPEARLRLQNKQLADAAIRQQLSQRLQQAGIAAHRISLHGPQARSAYLGAHAEVDLILDTFPFPGGTTTCEALWMGVPTLTLAGDRLIGRQGASLLAAAGLHDWIAQTPAEYVDKALAFAGDLPALATLRAGLRTRLRNTPLFDAPRFARNLEDALWDMWRRWHGGAQSTEDRSQH